jgi:hypothetical protein
VADHASRHVPLTDRDRQILSFMAEHRMVLESHLASLLESSAESVRKRLVRLAAGGYVSRIQVFAGQPHCCLIRQRGLASVGSRLRAPELSLGAYRHDVGVAWLWLAARRGALGPVADVLAERRLRSHDLSPGAGEPYAVRLGGYDAKGHPRRHYPDLLLVDARDRRMALELELSLKEVARRERILAGYGADRRLDGVIYLVENDPAGRSIGQALRSSAARMGLLERVHVRRVTPIEPGRRSTLTGAGRRRSATMAPAR